MKIRLIYLCLALLTNASTHASCALILQNNTGYNFYPISAWGLCSTCKNYQGNNPLQSSPPTTVNYDPRYIIQMGPNNPSDANFGFTASAYAPNSNAYIGTVNLTAPVHSDGTCWPMQIGWTSGSPEINIYVVPDCVYNPSKPIAPMWHIITAKSEPDTSCFQGCCNTSTTSEHLPKE